MSKVLVRKACNRVADARLVAATYLVALLTLLANDHLLKDAYGGALTGKLSDFTGLFAFALFFGAMAPRHARSICCAIAVLFTVWKSPLSQPAIDLWNAVFALQIDRVVDYSDLVALAVLPLAASAAGAARRAASARVPTLLVAVVSLFAFMGTSVVRYSADVPVDPEVRSITDSRPIKQVAERLESCGYRTNVFRVPMEDGSKVFITIDMRTRTTNPKRDISLHGAVHDTNGGVTIELETIQIFRQTDPIEIDPYVAEASQRIQTCLGKAESNSPP